MSCDNSWVGDNIFFLGVESFFLLSWPKTFAEFDQKAAGGKQKK